MQTGRHSSHHKILDSGHKEAGVSRQGTEAKVKNRQSQTREHWWKDDPTILPNVTQEADSDVGDPKVFVLDPILHKISYPVPTQKVTYLLNGETFFLTIANSSYRY
jgi:hypothetical protein